MEYCISEHHKLHRDLMCDDAIQNYLEHATKIPLYGIYFFKSKDSTGKDIDLGVTSCGMIVYQMDHIVNEFSWAKMLKISFKRRTFFIELKRELVSVRKFYVYFLVRVCLTLMTRIFIWKFSYFHRVKTTIRCLVLRWAHISMLKPFGNVVLNIIHFSV